MSAVRWCVIIFFISIISLSETYRILGIFPFNSRSHNGMFNALIRGLADRNHQVDVITHFPLKNPPESYNLIYNLNGTVPSIVNNFTYEFVTRLSGSTAYFIAQYYGNNLCELLRKEEIQKIIKNPPTDPPYDLVITEAFGAHCFMGFGQLLNVPVVAAASLECSWITEYIGNSDNLAFVPDTMLKSRTFDRTSFWDRLNNFITYYSNVYTFQSTTGSYQTDMMRRYMKPDMPHVREVEKSVALTLVNRHPFLNSAKPVSPTLIEVSGLHVDTNPPKLPQELQNYLDESTEGVVYFTLGSMVLFETLPEDMIKIFYESFAKIAPFKVLMKVYNPTKLPAGIPSNVLTRSWMPQQAVLAHKNVRVFMSHGGMMSCQEALYHGVPILGIPLFGDQYVNIEMFHQKGMALEIDIKNLTTTSLDAALHDILNDPKYRHNAKLAAQLFKDRPTSALETAVFWTEWVVRNDAKILKSPALDLKLYQLYLLDIFGFILLIAISSLITLRYFIKLILRVLCGSSNNSSSDKKKEKSH